MSNVHKSIDKFRSTVDNGSPYEGQQYIKTVYYRLRSRKSFEESRELLALASCFQYDYKEVISHFMAKFTRSVKINVLLSAVAVLCLA